MVYAFNRDTAKHPIKKGLIKNFMLFDILKNTPFQAINPLP